MEAIKKVDVSIEILNLNALMKQSIAMQATIIGKLENREVSEVYVEAMEGVEKSLKAIFEGLEVIPKKPNGGFRKLY